MLLVVRQLEIEPHFQCRSNFFNYVFLVGIEYVEFFQPLNTMTGACVLKIFLI